jgi:tetratricopeptide (TPR) repeat protein
MAARFARSGPIGAVIFVTAFMLRLVAAFQYSTAPDFGDPIGDSAIYVKRAQEILGGDLLGKGVPFHSSPLYPYFIALVLRSSGGSFFALRVVQIALGALGCVVISLLARRLAEGRAVAQLWAGLGAALYATLAFFDLDLLMISQTILYVGTGLWLLLRARESASKGASLLAGVTLGLAASDKPNLLLFVPVAAWFLAGELRFRPARLRLALAVVFATGVSAVILPIALRNLLVGHDAVLVSGNAGVNLYIGNNELARGTFALPPESGLTNTDLAGSSLAVAEQALGRTLAASEASRFWAAKAWDFAVRHPAREALLIGLKLRRLVGAYEIPNHLSLYYMTAEFIPVLRWLFVGAGLVFPLGLVGAGWRLARRATPADRLLCGFLVTYALSLLPFFVTERYRLPLVPVLIVYAAVLLSDWSYSRREAVLLATLVAFAALVVNWPAERFGYAFDRVAMATKYFERAHDRDRAIVQLEWALETDPCSADGHYNLGVAYESVGFYSGALAEFQAALGLEPRRSLAAIAARGVAEKLARSGDRSTRAMMPRTPFEEALALERAGRKAEAEEQYRALVRRDPFHFAAWERLGRPKKGRSTYSECPSPGPLPNH